MKQEGVAYVYSTLSLTDVLKYAALLVFLGMYFC